jgi:hypothetical protein
MLIGNKHLQWETKQDYKKKRTRHLKAIRVLADIVGDLGAEGVINIKKTKIRIKTDIDRIVNEGDVLLRHLPAPLIHPDENTHPSTMMTGAAHEREIKEETNIHLLALEETMLRRIPLVGKMGPLISLRTIYRCSENNENFIVTPNKRNGHTKSATSTYSDITM